MAAFFPLERRRAIMFVLPAAPDSFLLFRGGCRSRHHCRRSHAYTQLLQQLAAQMKLSKFRSHPRGEKKNVPKPKYDKKKPHVSTARLLAKAKEDKKAP